jgi:serine/threonine protein kinase
VNGKPTVKILDFGIAKVVRDNDETTAQPTVSAAATSSFTPMYAAPEQWLERFGATGTWTDVHAWALVCVELLTGKTPLAGREPTEFMAACLNEKQRPTPRTLGLELASEVEAVFERALAIDPSQRFPDAGAFWSSLCSAAKWSPRQSNETIHVAALDADEASRLSSSARTETATSLALRTGVTSTTAASLVLTQWRNLRSSSWGRAILTAGVGSLLVVLIVVLASNRSTTRPEAAASEVDSKSSERAIAAKQIEANATDTERMPKQAVKGSAEQRPPGGTPAATATGRLIRTRPVPSPAKPKKATNDAPPDAGAPANAMAQRPTDPWDQRL